LQLQSERQKRDEPAVYHSAAQTRNANTENLIFNSFDRNDFKDASRYKMLSKKT
jgi:hypothetical protein